MSYRQREVTHVLKRLWVPNFLQLMLDLGDYRVKAVSRRAYSPVRGRGRGLMAPVVMRRRTRTIPVLTRPVSRDERGDPRWPHFGLVPHPKVALQLQEFRYEPSIDNMLLVTLVGAVTIEGEPPIHFEVRFVVSMGPGDHVDLEATYQVGDLPLFMDDDLFAQYLAAQGRIRTLLGAFMTWGGQLRSLFVQHPALFSSVNEDAFNITLLEAITGIAAQIPPLDPDMLALFYPDEEDEKEEEEEEEEEEERPSRRQRTQARYRLWTHLLTRT